MTPSVSPKEFFATHLYDPKSKWVTFLIFSNMFFLYLLSVVTASYFSPKFQINNFVLNVKWSKLWECCCSFHMNNKTKFCKRILYLIFSYCAIDKNHKSCIKLSDTTTNRVESKYCIEMTGIMYVFDKIDCTYISRIVGALNNALMIFIVKSKK